MRLAERLLEAVGSSWKPDDLHSIKVRRLCVGLHWTVVESAAVGLAHTYRSDCDQVVSNAGAITGSSAWRLAQQVLSSNTLDASLGWAALRSLMREPLLGAQARSVDVRSWVHAHAPGKRIAVIGRFPFAASLGQNARELYRFEMEPQGDELGPEEEERILPLCDINVISASALINHTIDNLLAWGSKGCNLLVGPSTPMHPLLLEQGIHMLCGIEVTHPDALFRCVAEGAPGLRQMEGVRPLVAFHNSLK